MKLISLVLLFSLILLRFPNYSYSYEKIEDELNLEDVENTLKIEKKSTLQSILPCLFKKFPSTHEVIKDKINIRVDSRVSSLSLGQLNKGEVLAVIEKKYAWLKVLLPKRFTCYVSSGYVTKISERAGEVIASQLNLRSQPALSSPVLGQVKEGEVLFIVDKLPEWYKVEGHPYALGWVHKKFLRKTNGENTERMILVKKTVLKLNRPNMKKKGKLHKQLTEMGEEIIPQLESYFSTLDKSAIYSLIDIITEISKTNPRLVLDFLSKVDPAHSFLGGIYLDIVQNILKPQKLIKPYFYLATKDGLTQEEIKEAKDYLQKIYQKKFKTRNAE